jgi:hypothetical protein
MAGTVQFTVHEGIKIEEIHDLLQAYLGVTGCRTCGIAGWDFSLVQGDPAAFEQLRASGALQNVRGLQAASVMLNPQPLPPGESREG